jgi:hypothetical protein
MLKLGVRQSKKVFFLMGFWVLTGASGLVVMPLPVGEHWAKTPVEKNRQYPTNRLTKKLLKISCRLQVAGCRLQVAGCIKFEDLKLNIKFEKTNDLENYLNGLQSIYNWNDDNEVVKTFFSLAKKRFA